MTSLAVLVRPGRSSATLRHPWPLYPAGTLAGFARPTPRVEYCVILDDASGAESKERHQFEVKLIPGSTAGSHKTNRSLISVDDHRYDIIADVRECAEDLLIGTSNIRAGAHLAEIRRHQARVRRVKCH